MSATRGGTRTVVESSGGEDVWVVWRLRAGTLQKESAGRRRFLFGVPSAALRAGPVLTDKINKFGRDAGSLNAPRSVPFMRLQTTQTSSPPEDSSITVVMPTGDVSAFVRCKIARERQIMRRSSTHYLKRVHAKTEIPRDFAPPKRITAQHEVSAFIRSRWPALPVAPCRASPHESQAESTCTSPASPTAQATSMRSTHR